MCLFGSICDSQVKSDEGASKLEYKPGILDDFFMNSFRNKLVEVSLQYTKWGFVILVFDRTGVGFSLG